MDISLIIGWILGTVLLIYGIGIGQIGSFIDMPSIVIVAGGTVAALIASFPFRMLAQIPKHMGIMLGRKRYDVIAVIDMLVGMAGTARRRGLLILEEQADSIKDPFLRQSVMLIVDAMDAEKIRDVLESEVSVMSDRHEQAAGIYERGSTAAPAFGMIGTLVGLVNMLRGMNMEEGAGGLGKNMSIALISTFYGCIMAQLLFAPMAKKLRLRNDEEVLYKQIIIEGVLSIQAGDNPKYLKEKLLSYLAREQKKNVRKGIAGDDSGDFDA